MHVDLDGAFRRPCELPNELSDEEDRKAEPCKVAHELETKQEAIKHIVKSFDLGVKVNR